MAKIGEVNQHEQRLVRQTAERGNHPFATIWVLQCPRCDQAYGANSCDFHIRRCPCQGGKPGLEVPTA